MFYDRMDAGNQLAQRLTHYKDHRDVLILALPRGGAVTGFAIAQALHVPLDVLIVRKIGFPGQPELAIGAVSETGTVTLNNHIILMYGIPEHYLDDEINKQREEIAHRMQLYRNGEPLRGLEDTVVILVDDGVATGATMKAAVATLKKERLKKLVIALPVAPPETAKELSRMADEFICLQVPELFMAVGSFYEEFSQVSDQEVVTLLQRSTLLEGRPH